MGRGGTDASGDLNVSAHARGYCSWLRKEGGAQSYTVGTTMMTLNPKKREGRHDRKKVVSQNVPGTKKSQQRGQMPTVEPRYA